VANAMTGDRVHDQACVSDQRPPRPMGSAKEVRQVCCAANRRHPSAAARPVAQVACQVQRSQEIARDNMPGFSALNRQPYQENATYSRLTAYLDATTVRLN
jgi:hypothetical protein